MTELQRDATRLRQRYEALGQVRADALRVVAESDDITNAVVMAHGRAQVAAEKMDELRPEMERAERNALDERDRAVQQRDRKQADERARAEAKARAKAEAWLRDALASGPVPRDDVLHAADAAGHSGGVIESIAGELGVEEKRGAFLFGSNSPQAHTLHWQRWCGPSVA